ncbi:apoptosis facilitator Bcl-2-like protein 14 [Tenrec ecaudatus]|uniref:apoptosis facilitator Bcl-2-like protein 14 n=1 Tax=Tenrec ecaudatus TaxID=94439 RepID=UPI003F5A31CE
MCTARECDMEEIPLDEDESSSLEFKILAYYARHHVFKSTSPAFSPKLLRTRSLSQKGLGSWSVSDPWRIQLPKTSRSSQSTEKHFAKKKFSWIPSLGGGPEKEEDALEPRAQGSPRAVESPGGGFLRSPRWCAPRSRVEHLTEPEAVNPKVVSIANRVAEIVHSWPPPEDSHAQGGSSRFSGAFVWEGPTCPKAPERQSRGASAKKDGEDQIIAKIVELLKYSGDQLERELRRDKVLMNTFQDGLTYSVFRTITDQFLKAVDTRGESEVKAQGFKAALAIDVAAKLTAVDNHPMNRVLGFGTKYLKENFTPWVQQHGGWETILGVPREEID